MNDAGLISICALLAPSEAVREKVSETIGADRFLEVYLSAPIDVCRARETGGMYARADAGEIPHFPGVTRALRRARRDPDLVLPTHELDVEACVDRIVRLLESKGRI